MECREVIGTLIFSHAGILLGVALMVIGGWGVLRWFRVPKD